MGLTRREAMIGFGGGLALLAGPLRAEAAYPSRNIKMIVPYPPGGTTELLGRLIADQIKTGLNAAVIVENKPGAGTTLGARAEPDGYTLLMATSTTLAINKTLYKKLPYDPVKDFAPFALVAAVPFALIINPTIPAKTLTEFIASATGLRLRRQWQPAPSRRRDAKIVGRHRHPPCALSRQHPGPCSTSSRATFPS